MDVKSKALKPYWYRNLSQIEKALWDGGARFPLVQHVSAEADAKIRWTDYDWWRAKPVTAAEQDVQMTSLLTRASSARYADYPVGARILICSLETDTAAMKAALQVGLAAVKSSHGARFLNLGDPDLLQQASRADQIEGEDLLVFYSYSPEGDPARRTLVSDLCRQYTGALKVIVAVGEPMTVCKSLYFNQFERVFFIGRSGGVRRRVESI